MHQTEGVVIQDSAYADQLQQGFPRLRFDTPRLEAEFRAEYADRNLNRMRLGFAVASGLYLIFLAVRLMTESGPAAAWGLALRSLIIAAMVLTVVASYTPLRRWQGVVVMVTYVVFGAGVTAIEVVGHHHQIDRHYEGLIFVTVHAYVFSGLVFRQAFSAALVVFLCYLVGGAWGGLAGREWGYELFFMALLNMMGAAALFVLEHAERDSFLRRHLLAEMAGRDGLTGLHNRTAFLEHFDRTRRQAARERRAIGVMMLDVDYFKSYNDRFGHLEGDAALRRLAAATRHVFRRPLDLAARYGGEEFVGVWYDLEPGMLDDLVGELRQAIRDLDVRHPDSPSGRLTVSIGAIGLVPNGTESLLELIRQADSALYVAKSQGRDGVVTQDVSLRAGPVAVRA